MESNALEKPILSLFASKYDQLSHYLFFFLMGFTPCKTEQPLPGMEFQEKEAQKDLSTQEICLERTYS